MFKSWIETTTKRYLDRVFNDRFAEMLLKARLDLRRAEVIGEETSEMMLTYDAEYVLLETKTQVGETVEAWFDISAMKGGDVVEFEVFARIMDSEWKRWEKMTRRDVQDNPAIHLSPMMFPEGAKITVKVTAGRGFDLKWHIGRVA